MPPLRSPHRSWLQNRLLLDGRLDGQRLADQLAWIGSRLRHELVHPRTGVAGHVDVAFLVHVHLVRARQAPREAAPWQAAVVAAVRGEVVLEHAVRVVLEDPVEHPDHNHTPSFSSM